MPGQEATTFLNRFYVRGHLGGEHKVQFRPKHTFLASRQGTEMFRIKAIWSKTKSEEPGHEKEGEGMLGNLAAYIFRHIVLI